MFVSAKDIVQTISNPVLVLNQDGIATYLNHSASEMIGPSDSSVLTLKQISSLLFSEKPDECPILAAFNQKKKVCVEDFLKRKDGTRFPAKLSATPILTDSKINGLVLEIVDFSELKRKDELIDIFVHELKNPITSLVMLIQFLLKKYDQMDSARRADLLKKTNSQIRRLTELIDSLFDFVRIKNGSLRINPECIDLSELIREITLNEPMLKTVSLKIPREKIGYWDRSKIELIMSNLLSNAVKYGNGNPVEIELDPEDSGCLLKIKDNGIGISEDKINSIFGKFERATDVAKDKSLGLGLYIVKEIVQAHGGHIWVNSQKNKGSTFFVKIPSLDQQ